MFSVILMSHVQHTFFNDVLQSVFLFFSYLKLEVQYCVSLRFMARLDPLQAGAYFET